MTSGVPEYWSEDWLKQEYIKRDRTREHIAKCQGVSIKTITKHLERNGIMKFDDDRKYKDEEWLRENYTSKGYSARRLATEADCSKSTIRRYLAEYNISKEK